MADYVRSVFESRVVPRVCLLSDETCLAIFDDISAMISKEVTYQVSIAGKLLFDNCLGVFNRDINGILQPVLDVMYKVSLLKISLKHVDYFRILFTVLSFRYACTEVFAIRNGTQLNRSKTQLRANLNF